jgi:hypothetical protein
MRRAAFVIAVRVLVAMALIGRASPALAWEPGPDAAARLARGQAWLEVRPDPAGASGLMRAGLEIDAPPDTVWAVMLNCQLAPRMVSNLRSCRVLDRDPAGRWDIREEITRPMLLPPVRMVFRSDYDPPHGYAFHRTGGDLPVLEGEWRLQPLDGGRRTRVLYEGRAALPFAAPGPLARIVLRQEIAMALQGLKRECLARR